MVLDPGLNTLRLNMLGEFGELLQTRLAQDPNFFVNCDIGTLQKRYCLGKFVGTKHWVENVMNL